MTYQLVKQLKDAGYPQTYIGGDFWSNKWSSEGGYEAVYSPTLSELIEACGVSFWNLEQGHNKDTGTWFCNFVTDCQVGSDEWESKGKTPEEAVAKLWLALNSK